MKDSSDNQIENIIDILKKGLSLSEDYRLTLLKYLEQTQNSLLFAPKKEYELIYADKEREEDILADTMAVPLQKVKTFRNGVIPSPLAGEGKGEGNFHGNGWTNMLIFGDNLQVLKTLVQMKEKGKLKNADGTPGVRLIYIDPLFIIAPAASVQFLEDYIEKGKTRYFILRIPYSIIEEIHNRGFTKIKQPVSEMDVNNTVDAVGFDFVQTRTVECKYCLDKPKSPDLLNQKTKECVIELKKFESKILSRKLLDFKNLETLSMVMLDYDFDREVFDLDEVFYAEDLKKNDYEVRFAEDKIKEQIMVIYIDIFGNEKREVKTMKDFKK